MMLLGVGCIFKHYLWCFWVWDEYSNIVYDASRCGMYIQTLFMMLLGVGCTFKHCVWCFWVWDVHSNIVYYASGCGIYIQTLFMMLLGVGYIFKHCLWCFWVWDVHSNIVYASRCGMNILSSHLQNAIEFWACSKDLNIIVGNGNLLRFKIEYHAIGDTLWQPLLSYGKWCTEFKIGSFLLILSMFTNMIKRKQLYTNRTSSRWNKLNKMRHFIVIADLNVAQKKIEHSDLFSSYFEYRSALQLSNIVVL